MVPIAYTPRRTLVSLVTFTHLPDAIAHQLILNTVNLISVH